MTFILLFTLMPHYSVRDEGIIRKLAAYIILGITVDGKKDVLSISVGDNESSKYWLSVLNELKNQRCKGTNVVKIYPFLTFSLCNGSFIKLTQM